MQVIYKDVCLKLWYRIFLLKGRIFDFMEKIIFKTRYTFYVRQNGYLTKDEYITSLKNQHNPHDEQKDYYDRTG